MAQFTNQARLSYNDTVVNSNIAVGEIRDLLSASKDALAGTYRAGDRVTYVISIVNTGSTAQSGVTVTDNLGAYTFGTATLYPLTYAENSVRVYAGGVPQAAPAVTAGPPLVISNLTVPAASSLLLIYEAVVNGTAPLGAEDSIVNTATVSGAGLVTPITVSETVNAAVGPDLTITKSIEPVPVNASGTVTYTFVIRNYGNAPATAADNAAVTDTFDPALSNLAVTFDGAAWTAPANYTYTGNVFATIPGGITVPAATYTQDAATGVWSVTPGTATLRVTGTI